MFEIEKNVPMTPDMRGIRSNKKYPFGEMQVGDSFAAPVKQNNLSGAAIAHAKKYGVRFSTRKIDNDNTRVWRIA